MDAETPECWLPVLGYEGSYEVSDLGRVRSVDRVLTYSNGSKRRQPGVLLSTDKQTGRYRVVLLGGRTRGVHVLVLEAFVSPRPSGMFACHENDVGHDNRLENLRWATPRENQLDRVRNGNNANANKTECARGHPYDNENTVYVNRGRACRECMRLASLRCYGLPEAPRKHRSPGRPGGTCMHGHVTSPENTAPDGSCRQCRRDASARHWQRNRGDKKVRGRLGDRPIHA